MTVGSYKSCNNQRQHRNFSIIDFKAFKNYIPQICQPIAQRLAYYDKCNGDNRGPQIRMEKSVKWILIGQNKI